MEEKNKKDFLEDDSLAEDKPTSVYDYVLKNSKKVISISLGAIAVVVLLYLVFTMISQSSVEKEEKASLAISRVLPYYQQTDSVSQNLALYGDASLTVRGEPVIGLTDVVKNFEGTKQGKIAALYSGNIYLNQNKLDEAENYFKIASKADAKVVLEGAYAGLGVINEKRERLEDAISNYIKASQNATSYISKNRYEYFAALCYEQQGKTAQAEEIMRNIIGENKSPEFVGRAKSGLIRLGTVIE